MEKEQTFYQELKAKGYTRRQFLKFCGIMGAMLGLHQTGIAQVVNALQTKPQAGSLVSLSRVYLLQRIIPTVVSPACRTNFA